ncbi:MAG: TIGR00282 family metallophosphoesterase [Thermoguttaceae bacterium]
MRLFLIGDIVGRPGRQIVGQTLAEIKRRYTLDFVVANAENSASGSGITPEIYWELIDYGIDCITLGDHAFKRKEIFSLLDRENRIVRPGNAPPDAPGKKFTILPDRLGRPVAVFTLLGRVFMNPIDCPFRAADVLLEEMRLKNPELKVILLDFHAEATSDKQIMGRHLDGRVSAVLGTHTHVATADEQVFPGKTAFQCDVGMTGPFESIIGRDIKHVYDAVRTGRPTTYDIARNDLRLSGTIVEVDSKTGYATGIERICIRAGIEDR